MGELVPFEREECLHIINKLISKDFCLSFVTLDLSSGQPWQKEYRRQIRSPMDLTTIKQNLQNNRYRSMNAFKADVELVWMNAIQFNGDESFFACLAREGRLLFEKLMAKLCKSPEEKWIRKVIKVSRALKETATKLSLKVLSDVKAARERHQDDTHSIVSQRPHLASSSLAK
jgi:hypothetical protein